MKKNNALLYTFILAIAYISFFLIPCADAESVGLHELPMQDAPLSIVPDGEGGIYALLESGMEHLSGEDDGFEQIALPQGGLLALSCNVTDLQTVPSLTLLGIGILDSTGFTAESGIRVIEADNSMSVMEHLSYSLSVHDHSIDVYGLMSSEGLEIIKEKRMFLDLRRSKVLSKLAEELYPNIRKAITGAEGELVGWPIEVQTVMRWDEGSQEILEQYGIKYPYTFEEMLDAAKALVDMDALNELNLKLFNSIEYSKEDMLFYFMRLYITQRQLLGLPLEFDTPLFTRVVSRILAEVPVKESDTFAYYDRDSLFKLEAISPVIQGSAQLPLQLESDSVPVINTVMVLCVVNPLTDHMDEALAYLEYAAQKKDEYAYAWYESMRTPMENPQITSAIADKQSLLEQAKSSLALSDEPDKDSEEIELLQSQINALQEKRWIVSPEAVESYHAYADSMFISEGMYVVLDDGLQHYSSQLLNGLIDVPTYIKLCSKRAEMIAAE